MGPTTGEANQMAVIRQGGRIGGALLALGLSLVVTGHAMAASAPVNTVYPSFTGPVRLGEPVTASPGTWQGDPAPTFTYQWQRCFPVSPATSSVIGTTGAAPGGIALDRSGNVYAVNRDSNNITRISTTGVVSTFGTTGARPTGIAVDGAGNAYTANQDGNNVTKITPAGVSSTLGNTGETPTAIALDAAGNVYTANQFSDNISRIVPGGGSSIVGTTGGQPISMAFDPSGNIYTANFGTDDVSRIVPGSSSGILGTAGKEPSGIALDSAGNAYVTNSDSNNVSRITPGGASAIFASVGNSPGGIGVDSDDNVFVANYFSSNVSMITPEGVSSVLGRTGNGPAGLALDAAGNVYTTNFDSNSVSKITRTNCIDLQGATGQTYTPVTPDQGRRIRVVVTATNSQGVVPVPSARSEEIAPSGLRARLSRPRVEGPTRVSRGGTATYRVTVKNTGRTQADGVRLRFALAGSSFNAPGGAIRPGNSRTLRVKVRFQRSGRFTAVARVSANNADTTRTTRRITVSG